MSYEEKFMLLAIKEAQKAAFKDEVPVGCVIVKDGKILAKTHNLREKSNKVMAHAEMLAINKVNKNLKSWRVPGVDVYVTLEPCIMCAGTLIQSRIAGIFYGADDFKGGALGSSINVLEAQNINHKPEVHKGILKDECANLLKDFFKNKRENVK
mgnify:CR=1 FL=1